jgi:hypothetical protein
MSYYPSPQRKLYQWAHLSKLSSLLLASYNRFRVRFTRKGKLEALDYKTDFRPRADYDRLNFERAWLH